MSLIFFNLKNLVIYILFFFKLTHQKKEINPEEFDLKILTEESFQNSIKIYPQFFILVHSPWCKWSQKFSANLAKINEYLRYESQSLYLGLIDATLTNTKILKDYIPASINPESITYPQLIYIENGIAKDFYNGILDVDNTYLWIKRKIHQNSQKVTLIQVFETKVKFDKSSFIFFGDFLENKENFEIYNKLAGEIKSQSFYHSNDVSIYNQLNPSRNYTIGYLKYGRLNVTFNDIINEENIRKFISKCTVKNFYDGVTEESIEDVFFKKSPAIVFFLSKYDDEYMFYFRTFKKISQDLKIKVKKILD